MAGYSGTPLVKKLGIKGGSRAAFVGAPGGFVGVLGPLPEGTSVVGEPKPPMDYIHLFETTRAGLERRFPRLASTLAPAGMIWVSWPKKSSGVASDLTEDVVRDIGLSHGLVDTKVCAVDETWSALRFVIRLKDRPGRATPGAVASKPARRGTA
jgi:hypothetical protein